MTTQLIPLKPEEVAARLRAGRTVLVDIREQDEFARTHVKGAVSQPLSQLEAAQLTLGRGEAVVFTCRTGVRTGANCERLAARIEGPAYVLAGGLDAWRAAGLPLETDSRAPLEIMRQVQIGAGGLVLLGLLLGVLVHPAGFGLSALAGAGLMTAGVTGFCGMARLLALAPWNRTKAA